MTTPVRLSFSRQRGFNLQRHSREVNGLPAVLCSRPGKWGNPFRGPMAAMDFRRWIMQPEEAGTRAKVRAELRGFNLACYCGPSVSCHASVLLEVTRGDNG